MKKKNVFTRVEVRVSVVISGLGWLQWSEKLVRSCDGVGHRFLTRHNKWYVTIDKRIQIRVGCVIDACL